MEETARLFNLKLEPRDRARLTILAETTGTSMSGVILDSMHGAAKLIIAASRQTFESMQTLHDRIGEDGIATITVIEGEDGAPVAHLIMGVTTPYGTEPPSLGGLKAVAHVIGDRCHIFLDVQPELPPAPTVFEVGEITLRVGSVQVKVGEVPWPPTQHRDTPFPHSREAIQLSFDPLKLPDILGNEPDATEAPPPKKQAKRRPKPATETT
jgi:hypothetical protein